MRGSWIFIIYILEIFYEFGFEEDLRDEVERSD